MIYIKDKKRRKKEFQFFFHQFVESGIKNGFEVAREYKNNKIHRIIVKLLDRSNLLKIIGKRKKRNQIIIAARGEDFFNTTFPYYNYEIIPMLWDVWPNTWNNLFSQLQKLNVNICFVTVRQIAQKIEKELGIKCYWIPEGIDISDYSSGDSLANREIDVYELGRQHPIYHNNILNLIERNIIKSYRGNTYTSSGVLTALAFPSAESLIKGLTQTKIVICFPQTDTHPQHAGGLETLTQRYWEAMLSRCLILGRSPKELIDFIGYDPVINIDWNEPELQIQKIIANISNYQELVDKNYNIAQEKAAWDHRIDLMKKILISNNYSI